MDIEDILRSARTIAVVGCSRDPSKDAHSVPRYMQEHGYRIIPVNPSGSEILGERCYARISDVQERVDILDIFRPSAEVLGIVKEAVEMQNKPRVIWAQLGIVNDEAKKLAEENGIAFVQDKCIRTEHQKIIRETRLEKEKP